MFSRLFRLLRKHRIWLLLIVCTAVFGITLYNVVRPPPEEILDLSPPKLPSNRPPSVLPEHGGEAVTTAVSTSEPRHDVTISVHPKRTNEEKGEGWGGGEESMVAEILRFRVEGSVYCEIIMPSRWSGYAQLALACVATPMASCAVFVIRFEGIKLSLVYQTCFSNSCT